MVLEGVIIQITMSISVSLGVWQYLWKTIKRAHSETLYPRWALRELGHRMPMMVAKSQAHLCNRGTVPPSCPAPVSLFDKCISRWFLEGRGTFRRTAMTPWGRKSPDPEHAHALHTYFTCWEHINFQCPSWWVLPYRCSWSEYLHLGSPRAAIRQWRRVCVF